MNTLYCLLHNTSLENNKKILFSVLFLLIIASLVPRIYGLFRLPKEFLHNDGGEYRNISEQLARGNGFSVSYYRWYEASPPGADRDNTLHVDFSRPPMLPLLGALLYLLPFDWMTSAKVTALLLSVLCILATFQLSREVFSSNKLAVLAAGIYAFYPYSIYHSLCWSSENLFLLFLCISYCFLFRCIRQAFNWKDAALCGIMLALAVLTRPQGILLFLLLGFCGGIFFFLKKETRRKVFLCLAAFAAGGLLTLSPWMIRNWHAAGIPSPLSFYGPYSFAQASSNVSYATYRYVDTPEYRHRTDQAWNSFHAEKIKKLEERNIYHLPDAAPYWKKWAWEYIREHPDRMAFIIGNRLLHCFRAAPNIVAVSPAAVLCFRVYFVFFFCLFLCGIWFAGKQASSFLLLLPPLCMILLAIPFLMILRYRYPFFAPYASILAAYGLYRIVLFFAEKRSLRTSSQNSMIP